MRRVRKLVALLLSLAMVLAMSGMAMAATVPTPGPLSDGEVGGFYPGNVDNPQVQAKSVYIQKEITAYNPDEVFVYGPEITYTYSIAAASGNELVKVTDQTDDHSSGVSVEATVLPGVGVSDVSLTGTADKAIAWTNADILDATSAGASNIKNLEVDFSNVVFSGPGVYRYKITESATYTNTGVTDGDISAIRYLDVYVMRSSAYDPTHDASTFVAADWSIYGYVCISPESVNVDKGGETAVDNATVKTNGFVNDGTNSADEYYTYNFTVTKDLVGDNNMINHQFPLTVAFNGGPSGKFQLIAKTDGSKSSLTTTDETATATLNGTAISATIKKVGGSVALASFANAGTPKVADGDTATGTTSGYIKYIGIPVGFAVTVTEENDVVGTTYKASGTEDGTAATINGSTDTVVSIGYNDTAAIVATKSGAASSSNANVTIQFTNTLETISPTGLMFRYGPYVLILLCGALLLFLGVKFMRRNKEEN